MLLHRHPISSSLICHSVYTPKWSGQQPVSPSYGFGVRLLTSLSSIPQFLVKTQVPLIKVIFRLLLHYMNMQNFRWCDPCHVQQTPSAHTLSSLSNTPFSFFLYLTYLWTSGCLGHHNCLCVQSSCMTFYSLIPTYSNYDHPIRIKFKVTTWFVIQHNPLCFHQQLKASSTINYYPL